MNVYIVVYQWWDETEIHGVYSSRGDAQNYINGMVMDQECYRIESHEVK